MSQLYDISYSDWEDQQRWVLEGPDMSEEEFNALWETVRKMSIQIVGKRMGVVYSDMIIDQAIDILSEMGFKAIQASHRKHFTLNNGKDGLHDGCPNEWLPRRLGGED